LTAGTTRTIGYAATVPVSSPRPHRRGRTVALAAGERRPRWRRVPTKTTPSGLGVSCRDDLRRKRRVGYTGSNHQGALRRSRAEAPGLVQSLCSCSAARPERESPLGGDAAHCHWFDTSFELGVESARPLNPTGDWQNAATHQPRTDPTTQFPPTPKTVPQPHLRIEATTPVESDATIA